MSVHSTMYDMDEKRDEWQEEIYENQARYPLSGWPDESKSYWTNVVCTQCTPSAAQHCNMTSCNLEYFLSLPIPLPPSSPPLPPLFPPLPPSSLPLPPSLPPLPPLFPFSPLSLCVLDRGCYKGVRWEGGEGADSRPDPVPRGLAVEG